MHSFASTYMCGMYRWHNYTYVSWHGISEPRHVAQFDDHLFLPATFILHVHVDTTWLWIYIHLYLQNAYITTNMFCFICCQTYLIPIFYKLKKYTWLFLDLTLVTVATFLHHILWSTYFNLHHLVILMSYPLLDFQCSSIVVPCQTGQFQKISYLDSP